MVFTDFQKFDQFRTLQAQQVGHPKNELFYEKSKFLKKKDFLKIFFATISEITSRATFLKKNFVKSL
jgi:hypothetical protein